MHKLIVMLFAFSWSLTSLAAAQEMREYHIPLSSDLDQKTYRGFVMKNGLKVLLVSDPKADRSGASMDVHVGSGSDPAGWNGLAHFLEHMLFLGTQAYPEAGEYQAFIKDHGGETNAYTAYDHTNYHFSVNHESLEPALDRFSRFFIAPTFDAQYVERERAIVHSEYQALRKDEGRRIWETQKTILNPGHPASRFSVGSEQTLRDREGVTVRERLIDFYNQWYSADIMALAVVGREPLDILENWVTTRFSPVPSHGVTSPVYIQSYLNRDLAPAQLEIVPEKDIDRVSFQWAIPSVLDAYSDKPLSYLANLLGHEGEGSLLAALKQRGWAESLSAGPGFMDQHQGTLLVSIGLTASGGDHVAEIGEMLFRTIALIRNQGLEEWRFREQQQLGEIAFRFAEPSNGGLLARMLSARMHDYPFEDILRSPYIMEQFQPDQIRVLLDHLKPEKVYLQLVSQRLRVRQISDWYGVRYGISPVKPDWIARWQAAENMVFADLRLPDANPFIPQRLELVDLKTQHEQPVPLMGVRPLSAWYRGDQEFRVPKASFFISLRSSFANNTVRNSVLTEVLVRMLNDQLNAVSYPAKLADVAYNLYRHSRGMSIRITGFQDRQPELLQTVLNILRKPTFETARLELIKEDLSQGWKNRMHDRPSDQTIHEIYRLVIHPYWTEAERLEEITGITIEDVRRHAQTILSTAYGVTLAHGDLTAAQAGALNRQVIDALPYLHSEDQASRLRIRRLGYESPYLRTIDVNHGDTALSYYYQGDEKSYRSRAASRLLGQIIESPFYYQLRTRNRVGYLVFATSMNLLEVPGLLLSVQSSTHHASEIDALVLEFLLGFDKHIAAMDSEEFRRVRDALVARILTRDTNLVGRSDRYWREIDLGEFDFNSREMMADAVRALSQEEMVGYVRSLLWLKPRVIRVQSPGRRDGAKDGALQAQEAIRTGDPQSFRLGALGYFPAE